MIIFRSFAFYLAILGIIAVLFLVKNLTAPPPVAPHFEIAVNPYDETIAAAGIVEAVDKNIAIGVPVSSLVKEVFVKVGDEVNEGTVLFRLDDRDLLAKLIVQKAQIAVAKANLERLEDQLSRLKNIEDIRAISQEEFNVRKHETNMAKTQLEVAEAEATHTLLMLEKLCICAPQKGTILQQNIRKGEYVQAGGGPPIILGNLERLQVRAEIDEQNAPLISPHCPASAFPKNNSSTKIALRFERIEPMIIPKLSLTGGSNEKVDTRVLHVIYSFEKDQPVTLYVGNQVDVFIENAVKRMDHAL